MTEQVRLVTWKDQECAHLDQIMGRLILQPIGKRHLVNVDPSEVTEIGHECPVCNGTGWVGLNGKREFNIKGNRKSLLVLDAPGTNVVLRVNDVYHLVTATDIVKEAKGEVAEVADE